MPRYELPPDLTPEEERAVLAALERALASGAPRLSPWALAGRAENLRIGALHVRHQTGSPWSFRGHVVFAARGTPTLHGRADAR